MNKFFITWLLLSSFFLGQGAIASTLVSFDSVKVLTSTSADTLQTNKPTSLLEAQPENETVDDADYGLLFFVWVGVTIIIFTTIIFTILAILAVLLIVGMISFGLMSVSVLIGIYNKSFQKGFHAFVVLMSSVFCLILFSITSWFVNKVMHWGTSQMALGLGAAVGLVAGLCIGLLSFYLFKQLIAYFKGKLRLINK